MRLLCLLLICTAACWAGPLVQRVQPRAAGENKCAPSCPGSPSNVRYEPGKQYVYDVVSKTVLNVANKKVENTVNQKAKAHISVHSACEFSLKLTDVSLSGMNVAADWKQTLEKNPLRFGFEDGKVVSVCPDQADPVWAVNVKRAILSAFQSQDDDWETDVVGECPVKREVSRTGTKLVLKSVKNVAACTRSHDVSGVRSVPYLLQSDVQTAPIFESTQTCERTLDNSVLKQVKCTELHRTASPFGEGDAVTANVDQTLTYVSTASAAAEPKLGVPSTISYDHSEDTATNKGSTKDAKANMDILCKEGSYVASKAASSFTDLIFTLRTLSANEIKSIADNKCGPFIDALAMCASADCVQYLSTLINSGTVPESVYQSLALLPNPKPEVIKVVSDVVDKTPHAGLLSLSSLVQSYCVHRPECATDPAVLSIIKKLVSKLPANCNVGPNHENIKKAVLVLKAIGNIAYESESLATINKCLDVHNNHLNVKLAAIDALRRKPCTEDRNKKISQHFYDKKENVELRLASFRQLMQCADDEIVKKVVEELSVEPLNQVGSYVTSYLNSKRGSKNPSSKEMQRLVKRQKIPDRFAGMDPRRFSRYYEVGYFDPESNYGGHADSSVIFDPKGYIPRQVNLNLTLHLFGKSYNIFEVGGRAEGLEPVGDEVFGVDGSVFHPFAHDLRGDQHFRFKNEKANQLKELFFRKGDYVKDRVTANYYMRMFGDDLYYKSIENDDLVKDIQNMMDVNIQLKRMSNQTDVKVSRNVLLAALTKTLPTLSGLPLQFGLNASLSSKCDHKSKVNIEDLLDREKKDAEILYETRPSVSANVGASLVIKANKVASGVRGTFTMHAARSFGTEIKVMGHKIFSVKLLVPDDEIVGASLETSAEKIDSNKRTPLKKQSGDVKKACSGTATTKLLGLKSCLEFENKSPEMKASFKVEKSDPKLKYYEFKVESEEKPDETKFTMSVDTPGSQVDRKMATSFELSLPKKKLKIDVTAPFKKISLDGDLTERVPKKDYAAKLKLSVDGKTQYNLDGNVKADVAGTRKKYAIDGKAAGVGSPAAELTSNVEYDTAKTYVSVDFNLNKVFDKPIAVKGLLDVDATKYKTNLAYSGPEFTGNVEGALTHSGFEQAKGLVKGEYQAGRDPKHSFNIAADHTFKRKPNEHDFVQSVELDLRPLQKMSYKLTSNRKGDVMKNTLETTRGNDKSVFNVDLTRKPNNVLNAVATAKSDRYGLNHKADITYKNKYPQAFMLKVDAETPKTKDLAMLLEYSMNADPKWQLQGKAELKYPGRYILATEQLDQTGTGKFASKSHVEWDPKGKIDADSDITFRPENHEYVVESKITVAGVSEPFYIRKIARKTNDLYSVHWQAKQGSKIIYELLGELEGKLGAKQRVYLDAKSEKFDPKFQYQVVGNVQAPKNNEINADLVVKKDGMEYAKGDVIVPVKLSEPSKKFRGDFKWKQNNKQHSAVGEYTMKKEAKGTAHRLSLESDNNAKLGLQLDTFDKVRFQCDLEKDGKKITEAQLQSTPLKWDNLEFDGFINTDKPLPKKSAKTKAILKFKDNEAKLDGSIEVDRDRYLAQLDWKKDDGRTSRSYAYSANVDTPHGGFQGNQKLEVEKPFSLRKATTKMQLKVDNNKKYELDNDITKNPNAFKTETQFKSPNTKFEHKIDYTKQDGRRKILHTVKCNEKQAVVNLETVYKDSELKIDVDATSSMDRLKKAKAMIGCKKEGEFWNCEADGNVNDKYIARGHEKRTPSKVDVEYALKLDTLVDNEGKILLDMNKPANKYVANALLRHFAKKYSLDLNLDKDKGTLNLQTPNKEIKNGKLTVKKVGTDEYQVTTERNGKSEGNVDMQLRTKDNDQLFRLKITEIPQPFEILLSNKIAGNKQDSAAQLTLDPQGAKKRYGVENTLESEANKFRALKVTLHHPKRSSKFELGRPAQNKYSLSVQPDINGRRKPTVVEMSYDKKPNGINWQGSFSDDALKSPLKAKIDYSKNAPDEHNYEINLKTEFDYSGVPNKLLTKSLHIKRSPLGRTPADGAQFEAEFKTEHPASNLHTRLWAKFDRKKVKELVIPVKASLGLELKDANKNLAQYSLNAESDATTYTEYKLNSPNSMLKARIDKVNDKHFKLGLYRDSDKASLVGELKIHDKGADLEIRDEKSGDIKLHASAGMPTDHNAELELWHSNKGQKTRDARFGLSLDRSNILKANIYVRPSLENDVVQTAQSAAATAQDLGKDRKLSGTLLGAHKKVAEEILNTVDPMVKAWVEEQKKFAKELGPEFVELVKHMEESYEMMKEGILYAYDHTKQAAEELLKAIPKSKFIEQLRQLKPGGNFNKQIQESLKPLSDLVELVNRGVAKLQKQAADALNYLDKALNLGALRKALDEFKKKLMEMDIFQVLLGHAKQVAKDYALPAEVSEVIKDVEANRAEIKSKVVELYQKIRDSIVDEFSESSLTKTVAAILDAIAPDEFDQAEIRKRCQIFLDFVRGRISSEELSQKLWKKYIPVVTRKGPGEAEITILLPQPADSLKDIFENLHPDRIAALQSVLADRATSIFSPAEKELADAIHDTVHMFKPFKGKFFSAIPPFKSTGYLVGPSGFISFDGRPLQFNAKCGYLLAADFIDSTFLIIGKVDPLSDKTHPTMELKMEFRGDVIELMKDKRHPEGIVKVNGAQVSLPWQKIDTNDGVTLVSVVQDAEWIALKTYYGIKLKCNSKHNFCRVILPGYLHGRSAGLLGFNDNEPANDRDLVDGTANDNTNLMAEHWAVEGVCKENLLKNTEGKKDETCSQMFGADGPMKSCYSQARGSPFEKLCNSGKDNRCGVAAAFAQICDKVGATVAMPDECVSCKVKDKQMIKAGESVDINDQWAKEKHHVILLVEETECMQAQIEKIPKFAEKMAQKNKNVQFTWVGYGGQGAKYEPHVHYIDGLSKYDAKKIAEIAKQPVIVGTEVDKQPDYCPIKALKWVAHRFAPKSSTPHSIVFIPCTKCEESISSRTEFLDAFISRGIKLNVLTPSKLKTSDNKKIVGADAEQLYTDKGVVIKERAKLTSPTDVCSVVAQETGGGVFNFKNGYAVAAGKITAQSGPRCAKCQCQSCTVHSHLDCHLCEPKAVTIVA